MSYLRIVKILRLKSDPKRAQSNKWFFKTGKGQYGFGDKFFGISMPQLRVLAKEFSDLDYENIGKLFRDKFHEARMLGVLILVGRVSPVKIPPKTKKEVFDFYIKNIACINNWDLVDSSAPQIVGKFLIDQDKSLLYKLADKKNLWEKRIAIVSTMYFIKYNQFSDTLKICEILMNDEHDLIHKACGWMLREIYKKNKKVALDFIEKNAQIMPRTMLRYSIEKMSQKERKYFLAR